MKKAFLLVIAACMLLLPTVSMAEQQMAVGVRVGGIWPDDIYTDFKSEDSYIIGADATYLINDNIGFRLAVDYYEYDVEVFDVTLGDISVTPITLGLIARSKINNIAPYIGAGVGYFVNDISLSGTLTTTFKTVTGTNLSADIDNEWGYFVNAGVEAFLNPNTAVGIDLRYMWCEPDITLTAGGATGTDEIDLDAFTAALTLRYYF
ncbi:MAG: OmpW family outer membrane protein [Thermodesulfobacteriota bacterium]